MPSIKLAIVGVGNCASALVQGISYCANNGGNMLGVLHPDLGGYRPGDIQIAAAFDIDHRKIGRDVATAIRQEPNCALSFWDNVPETGTTVQMGRILDGIADHMAESSNQRRFEPSDEPQPDKSDVVSALRKAGVEVLINFLPVGASEAAMFYADCALEAGVGMVNSIPVFLASDPEWSARFTERGLPIVGDDFKGQIGATILHRALVNLFGMRGVQLDRTYQLNIGGNTDFFNMLDPGRLGSKRKSKTEAVRSINRQPLSDQDIRIGPSDFVPWLGDNKIAYIRMDGSAFGGVPVQLEVRLSVEDSPNAAAVAIDAIRCVKIALDRGEGGPLIGASAFLCKHPPHQMHDEEALSLMLAHVAGEA